MAPIDKKLKKKSKTSSIDGKPIKKSIKKKKHTKTSLKISNVTVEKAKPEQPISILKNGSKKKKGTKKGLKVNNVTVETAEIEQPISILKNGSKKKKTSLIKVNNKQVSVVKNESKKKLKKKSALKHTKLQPADKVQSANSNIEPVKSFQDMGIDDRILEGIAGLRWAAPTAVQAAAIPVMLRGANVVAEARTGSGKSGAFLIPCLHRALQAKHATEQQHVRVLVLAPSKELCRQTAVMAGQLARACSRELRVLDLSPGGVPEQRPLLAELPDVVVGPPGRVLSHIEGGALSLAQLQSVVVDEADLMTTFQYGPAIERLWRHMPDYMQCFVTSATMSPDLTKVNRIIFRGDRTMLLNTTVLRLKDNPLPPLSQLTHWVVKLEPFQKAVFLYAMYKLRRLTGKSIIFVNQHFAAYKLRMFLGQMGLSTCLLNSELPTASRCHIIEEFNAGKYDMIIATDAPDQFSKKSSSEQDKESGTSRGLDFQFVETIVNYDFPPTLEGYIHRVGRTARGANRGEAVSLVSAAEHELFLRAEKAVSALMCGDGAASVFRTYHYKQEEFDAFSYRAQDPWAKCTKTRVLEVRRTELIQELRRSAKLESYFRAHPGERGLLRHDKAGHGMTAQPHLRHMPAYIIPDALRAGAAVVGGVKDAPDAPADAITETIKPGKNARGSGFKAKKKMAKANPLKSFTFSGLK